MNLRLSALLVFAPLLTALTAHSAGASVVQREKVTLGRLTESSDCVVIALVKSTAPSLQLEGVRALKGRAAANLTLVSAPYVRWQVGQRALIFLRQGRKGEGSFRPLVTEYQRVLVSDSESERALTLAVRSRIARLGPASDELPKDLFAQLRSKEPRVREDAAWDLLGQRSFVPQAPELQELTSALKEYPSLPILRLCALWPQLANLKPLLSISLSDDADTRREAAAALEQTKPGRAIELLRAKLLGPKARAAVRTAAAFGDLEAKLLLVHALDDQREEVRLEALSGLGRGDLGPAEVSALTKLIWSPQSAESLRRAVAGLALASAGEELRQVEQLHPDQELRRLAAQLRRDPVRSARGLLR